MHEVEEDEGHKTVDDVLFLGNVLTTGGGWTAQLSVNSPNICFQNGGFWQLPLEEESKLLTMKKKSQNSLPKRRRVKTPYHEEEESKLVTKKTKSQNSFPLLTPLAPIASIAFPLGLANAT